ncbi:hypothetical protein A2V54_03635 [candidate division WWE3 bacterium RBG_19FT_COMBO_53_11]|uniref:Metalloprotease TldD/E C-terminal domain-containing protein n=1 Tax=candidate division WWE3 bacterium RBG_19FT_COMBO_53_11 TaxID=1802613 RepID=A0A1F4UIR7_UNCKA|nr:MAG: hypothetical protein A2V54_03635 [candidate division WWE3 bacterium RBG_19FT_COMBO_53_11]
MVDEVEGVNSLPPDEYTFLAEEFARVVDRGIDSYQEQGAPGRRINYVSLAMDSRTVLICETDERGIPHFIVTGTETDNKGATLRQRAFIGAAAEVATYGRADQSANLAEDQTVVKGFEVGRQSYDLVENAVQEALARGEEVQRKIDEESYIYFPPLPRKGTETMVNLDLEPALDLNMIRDLVSLGWQEIKRGLGAKIDEAYVVFAKWAEHYIFADNEGARDSVVVPRVAFVVVVKTKKGSEAFGALRGSCGKLAEIFSRGDDYRGKDVFECVKILAAKVTKEAVNLDRAQSMKVVGNEFYAILSPGVSGVLAHEVYGHTSEGDIIAESRYSKTAKVNLKGRLGAQISSHKAFRILESGTPQTDLGAGRTIAFGWGSLAVDNRGDLPLDVLIAENGTMVGALLDRYCFGDVTDGLPANILKTIEERGLTGNARREKFDDPCLVRMRNTYICPDPSGPETLAKMADLIPRNKKGIYIASCHGGWVQTETGEFQITGNLGYLIENGAVTDKPVKDVVILGNITNFGDQIVALGSGVTVSEVFTGFCGKDGQWVPVESVGPLMLIKDVKAATAYSPRPWAKLIQDYLEQFEQVKTGQRRRENVYIQDVVEGLDEGVVSSHTHLCVSTALLGTVKEEIAWILGRSEHADFVSVEDPEKGRHLVRRSNSYDS